MNARLSDRPRSRTEAMVGTSVMPGWRCRVLRDRWAGSGRRIFAAGLVAAVFVAPASGHGGAGPRASGLSYAGLARQALATLEHQYYNGAVEWHQCVPVVCGAVNRDWGADSLTYALYFHWQVTHDPGVRPIVGAHLRSVDLMFNPIVDTDYTGGFGNLEFVPATRVAYNVNDKWAAAVEEYSDFGTLRQFNSVHDQFHEVWAVVDHSGMGFNFEAGVGVGVTAGSDRLTFKLMVSRDLNMRKN